MKALKYFGLSIILLIGILYMLLPFVLSIHSIQKKIAVKTSKIIEKQIGTPVHIDKIIFHPINQLIFKNFYLKDRTKNTFFTAKNIFITFNAFSFFNHSFQIYSICIDSFKLNLKKKKIKSPLNIQYIIEILKNSKKLKIKTHTNFYIQNFSLKNGYFSYKVSNKKLTPNHFNPYDIQLNQINANFQLKKNTNTNWEAKVFQLCFIEKSGLQVKKLSFDFLIKNHTVKIDRLILDLPSSHLKLKKISANYGNNKLNNIFSEKTLFKFQIQPSIICLNEMNFFSPMLTTWNNTLEIEGKLNGNFKNLQSNQLIIREKRHLEIYSSIKLNHLDFSNPSNTLIQAHINKAFITPFEIQKISKKINLPTKYINKIRKKINRFFFIGNLKGKLDFWKINLKVQSQVGNFQTNISFRKNGIDSLSVKIFSTNIHLNQFTNNPNLKFDQLEVNFNSTLQQIKKCHWNIEAFIKKLKFKSFCFDKIYIKGNFTPNSFNGILKIKSLEKRTATKKTYIFKENNSKHNLPATLSKMIFNKFHLNSKHKNITLSCQITTSIKENNLKNFVGNIMFQNLQFSIDTLHFTIDSILIESKLKEKIKKHWTISSDFLNGSIEGNFSIKTVEQYLKYANSFRLPSSSFILQNFFKTKNQQNPNNFQWNLTISNVKKLSKIFHLPFIIYQPMQIEGKLDEISNKFYLTVTSLFLKIKNYIVENGTLNLSKNNNAIEMDLSGVFTTKKKHTLIISANFKTLNDSIHSFINWNSNIGESYSGKLNFTTHLFSTKEEPFKAFVQVYPSEFVYNQLNWNIFPTTLVYGGKETYENKLIIQHNEQIITIEENLTKKRNEVIKILLKNVDLNFILKSLSLNVQNFGGRASGEIKVQDIFYTKQLSIDLHINQFSFNEIILGNLTMNGEWDKGKHYIKIKGEIIKNTNEYVYINGSIDPANKEISILFDVHRMNISFFQKYFNKILSNFSGQLTGKIHLFGNIYNPIIKGKAWIQDGSFKIKFSNTKYFFNDWITLNPNEISLQNFIFYDLYNNKSLVNASIYHRSFSHFQFNSNFNYNNLMIFNTNQKINSSIYGTVFATGKAFIHGNEKLVSIDISLENEKNSLLFLPFSKDISSKNYDFIHFSSKKNELGKDHSQATHNLENTEIQFNLLANINNGTALEIIIDSISNNKISFVGNGTLQIQYGTKTPLKIFGKYIITNGQYNFNFKQTFFKNFNIINGSSIIFSGDPMKGELNTKAFYTVSTNLHNLKQEIAKRSDSIQKKIPNQIPVNCILVIFGKLDAPIIKWDLELPRANSELESLIKNYIKINDIDMLNKQIFYLFTLGRFYTSEYDRNKTKQNDNFSLLTSTIFPKISNLFKLFKNKIQIETNLSIFQISNEENKNAMKFDLLLSSLLLNNQLTIKGNIGCIDKPSLHSFLVGDFDIEYNLNNNDNVWIKGFNHYDYENHILNLNTKMTQGLGILFQKNF